METKQKTCEERIPKEFSDRIKEIKKALKSDRALEDWEENLLGIEKKEVYTILLSWGGPADWFEVEVDPNSHCVTSITYHYSDWEDHAERELRGSAFDAVEQIFNYLVEI